LIQLVWSVTYIIVGEHGKMDIETMQEIAKSINAEDFRDLKIALE